MITNTWIQISRQNWFDFFSNIKSVFFSESAIRFSNLQIPPQKNIPNNYPDLKI